MAGLLKRGNTWYAVFTVAGKQEVRTTKMKIIPPGTPPMRRRSIMKETEAGARIIAQELEQAAWGKAIDAEKIKILLGKKKSAQLLHRTQCMQGVCGYLNDWLLTCKPGSFKNDKSAVKEFLAFLGPAQNMPLDAVTPDHAKRFMEKQMERVSSGTTGNLIGCLKKAFNRAIDKRLIDYNPFRGVSPKKDDTQQRRAFTEEEIERLVKILPGEWPDMIRVCLYTGGQRLGDIATLKWEQIDLEGGLIAMTTQKTKRRMNKPIIAPLMAVLSRRQAESVSKYVFPLAAAKHAQAGGTSSKLSLEFTGLLKEHGFIEDDTKAPRQGDRRTLSALSFHCLRYSVVTILRNAGVPPDLTRELVGHASEQVERIYYTPDMMTISKALDKLPVI